MMEKEQIKVRESGFVLNFLKKSTTPVYFVLIFLRTRIYSGVFFYYFLFFSHTLTHTEKSTHHIFHNFEFFAVL